MDSERQSPTSAEDTPPPKRALGRPKGQKGNHAERRRKPDGFATMPPSNDKNGELLPWEEAFAKWLAEQTTRVDHADEVAAIRLLIGQDLNIGQIKRTKRKLGFVRCYQSARASYLETRQALARSRYTQVLPKAAKAHGKAVDALNKQLDKLALDDKLDPLPTLRTAPALLNPFIDRSLPRKTEQHTTATVITVNLTPEQARGLDSPVMTVEAVEVVKQIPETV